MDSTDGNLRFYGQSKIQFFFLSQSVPNGQNITVVKIKEAYSISIFLMQYTTFNL